GRRDEAQGEGCAASLRAEVPGEALEDGRDPSPGAGRGLAARERARRGVLSDRLARRVEARLEVGGELRQGRLLGEQPVVLHDQVNGGGRLGRARPETQ